MTSRRALTVPALLAASAFCVLLVVFRRHHTGEPFYDFLVWNLVLAWVPLVLALLAFFAAGIVCGVLACTARVLRQRREIVGLKRELRARAPQQRASQPPEAAV